MSVMLYPCMFCVALSMDLFVDTICNMFGCGCYFVIECYGVLVWLEVHCWLDHVWSSKECVFCACDPSVHLDAPSISFVCVFVCRKLFPHLRV